MDDTQLCCLWGVCCGNRTARLQALNEEGFTGEQAEKVLQILDRSRFLVGLTHAQLKERFAAAGVRVPEPL